MRGPDRPGHACGPHATPKRTINARAMRDKTAEASRKCARAAHESQGEEYSVGRNVTGKYRICIMCGHFWGDPVKCTFAQLRSDHNGAYISCHTMSMRQQRASKQREGRHTQCADCASFSDISRFLIPGQTAMCRSTTIHKERGKLSIKRVV